MNLTNENSKGISRILIVVVALVLAVILFKDAKKVIDSILEALGLKDSKEESENKNYINDYVNNENAKGTKSGWNPQYYTLVPRGNGFAFTDQQCRDLCKDIWDSVGYVYDSPSKAVTAIKQCKNKRNLSFLADGMHDIYKVDLLNWLENKFDTSEQREMLAGLFRFTNSLPAS